MTVAAKRKVLIIDGDEWVAQLLATYLRERDYTVHIEHGAKDGFEKACALRPDCIVCNMVLPDLDGTWVARSVRTEPSAVSKTPFVFLTDETDKSSRLQGLSVGADLYLQRPFTHEEIAAQIDALIGMAARLRERESERVPPPVVNEPSSRTIGIILKGDIARMSIPTVMSMLELEKRSGELLVESDDGAIAIFFFDEGALVGARFQNHRAILLETLRHVLAWGHGKFTFMVTEWKSVPNAEPPVSVGHLLLEAVRLNDERDSQPDPKK